MWILTMHTCTDSYILLLLPAVFSSGLVLIEVVVVDEGVFGWPLSFLKLPTLNLMTTHINANSKNYCYHWYHKRNKLSMLPNVGGMLADVVSAEPGVLSVVVILHSSMKL